jgi:cysteinyl-tRNA synthetase
MLQIYDTLTKQKKPFTPIKPGEIGIYVCGMTVYDYCHIGHGRLFVVYDMVMRYLRWCNFKVKFVSNITDIDDKIIKRANESKQEYFEFAERFIKTTHEDKKALGVLPPDVEPRATQYIPQIISIIQTLIDKGYAYVGGNGDVFYQVNRFKTYGELAHQDLEKLRSGARIDVVDAKQDPLDFVLWKMAKPNEPSWDSPWGKGRPGWHIECSAMASEQLGEQFDIHGGGTDLLFPHHQNELAQSEAASGKKFVNYWMHMGMVQINREKMSKSLGNFFTIREVLQQYPAEIVRYFILASHYRSPINYSTDNLASAQAALERFYIGLRDVPSSTTAKPDVYRERFIAAMDDDFNTPEALAVLFDLLREINRCKEQGDMQQAAQLAANLKELANMFGILQDDPVQFLQGKIADDEAAKIQVLIDARLAARNRRDWAEADRIRQQLTAMNIILEDTPAGTVWRRS